ncbi:MAG: type II toxin-antitoxin system RelE/ParE family toxin [Terriglobales bacterium]
MQVEFSSFVEGDLDAIADYIAQDSPTRAVSFLREIGAQIHKVGQNPLLYQLRPEIGEGARMAIVGRYVILFRTMPECVRIERVVYGGRDLLALFRREE